MSTHLTLLKKVLNFSAERYLRVASDLFVYDGEYETALAMVEKALTVSPTDTRALVLKGDILFCLNRDMDALQQLNVAIHHDNTSAEAHISKAGVLDALGRPGDALEFCLQARQLITHHNTYLLPSLYDQLINLLLRLKKYRQAYQTYLEARSRLSEDDYQYLQACYQGELQLQRQVRRQLRERASSLKLTVIPGGQQETKQDEDPGTESTSTPVI